MSNLNNGRTSGDDLAHSTRISRTIKQEIINLNNIFEINLIDDKEIFISLKKDLTVSISADVNLLIDNLNIDTPNGKIHLNSRLSKQIKDLPESILYRKEIEKRQILINKHQDQIDKLLKLIDDKLDIDYKL